MFIHVSKLYDGRRILKNTDDLIADKFVIVLIVFIGLISSHNYKIAMEIELR